ncbi:MAG: hypothetical protein HC880_20440, partial [Bacteroidia bacterium]|nr:hypothetical protein [Bacteroidia bacterium]
MNHSVVASLLIFWIFSWGLSVSIVRAQEDAQYVWVDETGQGRNQYAYFRQDIELGGSLEQAQIHLFASSRYQLWVNGVYLNFGPC